MTWRNTRTGTIYDQLQNKFGDHERTYARKLDTRRWSLVRWGNLEEIIEANQLARIPAIHEHLRTKSYSVGSAMELLAAMEPDWSVERTVETLKVAVLLLGDEVDRVQGVARG